MGEEPVPDSPPDPQLRFGDPENYSENVARLMAGEFELVGSMTYRLLESAWRLVELSRLREGRYADGMAVPESSRAAAAGAIAISCAAFEAMLNETLFQVQIEKKHAHAASHNRLLELFVGLTPRDRLDALAAMAGSSVDWGSEPFQSLELLLTIRKHLLHHEPRSYRPKDGYWPAKHLKDIPRRIGSPYPTGPTRLGAPYSWDEHIFTPAGAEWAVRSLYDVADFIEDLEFEIRMKYDPDYAASQVALEAELRDQLSDGSADAGAAI